jgi:hypothetical protein
VSLSRFFHRKLRSFFVNKIMLLVWAIRGRGRWLDQGRWSFSIGPNWRGAGRLGARGGSIDQALAAKRLAWTGYRERAGMLFSRRPSCGKA